MQKIITRRAVTNCLDIFGDSIKIKVVVGLIENGELRVKNER